MCPDQGRARAGATRGRYGHTNREQRDTYGEPAKNNATPTPTRHFAGAYNEPPRRTNPVGRDVARDLSIACRRP